MGLQRRSPIKAAQVVGATPAWSEPRLSGGRLFWLERSPLQGGRSRLRMRPCDDLSATAPAARDLSPAGADLRSRIHSYGGGSFAVGSDAAGSTVVWVDDSDRCLWRLDLPPLAGLAAERADGPASDRGADDRADRDDRGGAPLGSPLRLTEPNPAWRFADGLIDRAGGRWIGVLEQGEQEALVSVPLAGGAPQLLRQPADFCGYAVLSPAGSHLAWVEWQRPAMPWERSQLWLGRLNAAGELADCRPIGGSAAGATAGEAAGATAGEAAGEAAGEPVGEATGEAVGEATGLSVFQPLWVPQPGRPADLVVACDRSGWWNLERLAAAEALAMPEPSAWQPLLPLEAEFGMPQWVYGMATTAWDGEGLVAAACFSGRWRLGRLTPAPAAAGVPRAADPPLPAAGLQWSELDLPFDDLAALAADHGRLVLLAASPSEPAGLLEVDRASGRWRHTPAAPCPLDAAAISRPEPLWFSGYGGLPTQAWYYPPSGGGQASAPLLVKGHSGPTGMARTGLNLTIQYWTSRGWGVVDVNYGGSTGFGKAYRQRLDRHWGIVDVADCAAAAEAVVAAGLADPQRIAIEGGSAAGFTVLAALCGSDRFRAGACRYAVADLEGMAQHTHRFEAGYLDSLLGPWPAAAAQYRERSPLLHADRIQAPVIFFQGLDDQVVPPQQTERMALALGERGIPVEVHLFPGEGHGFRDSGVQERVLEATEAFFRRHFKLD